MDNTQLHYFGRRIKRINVWLLVCLFVLSSLICILALRQNNLGMVAHRTAVYQADEKAGNVEAALQELRAYVASHMNTSLATNNSAVYPPVQLKYTYQRLKQTESERTKQASAVVYTDAQNHCERLYPGSFSGGPRVPCIEAYIAQHGVKERLIPDALYKFDFATPRWSPDLAGMSMLISIGLAIAIVVRLGLVYLIKKLAH
jgi:hypothetical protein